MCDDAHKCCQPERLTQSLGVQGFYLRSATWGWRPSVIDLSCSVSSSLPPPKGQTNTGSAGFQAYKNRHSPQVDLLTWAQTDGRWLKDSGVKNGLIGKDIPRNQRLSAENWSRSISPESRPFLGMSRVWATRAWWIKLLLCNFQPEIPGRPVSQTNHKAKHSRMEVQVLCLPALLSIFFLVFFLQS